ncbi:hypothetical protein MELA_01091 [Candidatus Methylomirabilis lanthanidiphila]|uniref:Uncharacterized protein n=1 Tax=Candidatus Methylomirabilis lanthanidiphila TaxID=2211376 RepID=A0A564ZIJ7_9BACT|nr:hypothetical protein [Candidatus Methylomirabilis lanthanidiphila]VUZ84717.1 hypothetical protein MELA_01091 [Candidatus Methylomirabilis lanthanidiphila]
MKQYLPKVIIMALVMAGLVAVTQPALAWVRVGINVGVPGPVIVARAPVVAPAPMWRVRPVPVYYRSVWVPEHVNRWGVWVPGHWR